MAKITSLKNVKETWDKFGSVDPLWAILTDPDKRGNRWQIDEFFETGVREINLIFQQLNSLGVTIPKRKSLDFGCGVGRLTQALAVHFEEVHGVDIAPSMIYEATKYNRYGDKCRYHLNETNDLSLFNDNSFDLIYTSITLQHMAPEYSKTYLKEFIRVLSPQGVLIFDMPSKATHIQAFVQPVVRVMGYALINTCMRVIFGRPVMEMHTIKKASIVKFLEANKAKILDIKQTKSAGRYWIAFQYYVTKE